MNFLLLWPLGADTSRYSEADLAEELARVLPNTEFFVSTDGGQSRTLHSPRTDAVTPSPLTSRRVFSRKRVVQRGGFGVNRVVRLDLAAYELKELCHRRFDT